MKGAGFRFLEDSLAGRIRFADKNTSFSPLWSNLGLSFGEHLGIENAWLHYNRVSLNLGTPFLQVRVGERLPSARTRFGLAAVRQTAEVEGWSLDLGVAFSGTDAWVIELKVANRSKVPCPVVGVVSPFHESARNGAGVLSRRQGAARFSAEFPAVDRRDPDWFFRFALAIRWCARDWDGAWNWSGEGQTAPVPGLAVNSLNPRRALVIARTLAPGESANLRLGFAAGISTAGQRPPHPQAPARLDVRAAEKTTAAWWKREFCPRTGFRARGKEARVLARAVVTLAFNATRAAGRLRHGVSLFPNRGRYPVHYFWDSFFQNLGLLRLNPALARDSLALLLANMEPDGKVPQFVASTWNRPGSSQCPLLGWGVLDYAEASGDWAFARRALPAIERNTRWWFRARDPEGFGLTACWDPFEVWDDTPRLDRGAIRPVDVNTLLAIQMDACARIAEKSGDRRRAEGWRARRAALVRRIVEKLYCPSDNLFYDRLVHGDRWLKIKTPACFMPLLLDDCGLTAEQRREMIRRWLLSRHFFGRVPFPVVAYDEPTYRHDRWWRGPMWPPIAWFMLEVLRRNGFAREHARAARRIRDLMVADGFLHELFDSKSGAGLGSAEQGWTAGVFLSLQGKTGARPRHKRGAWTLRIPPRAMTSFALARQRKGDA